MMMKKNKKNRKRKKKNKNKNKKKRTPAPPGNVHSNSFVPRAPKGTHAGEGSLASTKCHCLCYCWLAFSENLPRSSFKKFIKS